jgi:starch synthase
MRILVLSMEYGPEISGGVGTHTRDLSRGLAQAGNEVVTIAFTLGKERVEQEGSSTIHLLSLETPKQRTKNSSIVASVLDSNDVLLGRADQIFLTGFRPDIIQCANWLTLTCALELRNRFGTPIVSTIHFLSDPVESWWGQPLDERILRQERLAIQEADHLIAVSHSIHSLLRATHNVDVEKVSVVHNGIDVSSFPKRTIDASERAALRRALGGEARTILLYAGRINPQKGMDALFSSVNRLLDCGADIQLILAGQADSQRYAVHIRESIESSPLLKQRTRLLGKIAREELGILYQAADIAIVPSIYEPFGYSAVEAMAAATPVIASNAGGLAEIVQNNQTGLLIPVHQGSDGLRHVDVSELCESCSRLIVDPELAKTFGIAGLKRVREAFTLDAMVVTTQNVYKHLLQNS